MKFNRRAREQEGQAVVEFAAIMIPFAVLFILALDGALFFFGYVTAAHAVREGTRCGTVGGSAANIETKVLADLPGTGKSVTVTRTDVNSDGVKGIGDRITVSATWTYNWVTPLSLFGIPDGTTRTYTADMRLETDRADRACT